MKNKNIVIILILISGALLIPLGYRLYWLKTSDIEEKTRYFLQQKFNDKWKVIDKSIKFKFESETGRNILKVNSFEVDTQVEDGMDEFSKNNFRKSSKPLVGLDVYFNDDIVASVELNEEENYILVSNNGFLDYYKLETSNQKYVVNEEMEKNLNIITSEVAEQVIEAKGYYEKLVLKMNDNEWDVVLNKSIKNLIIVVSVWIITFIIKGILRKSIKYQATKIYPKEWR